MYKRIQGNEYDNKTNEFGGNESGNDWHHTWHQTSQPGSHRGEYPHFYAQQRGTPTSIVLTSSTDASQAMFFYQLRPGHSDLLISIAPMDPSPTRSRTEAVPSGEHRQSHTWTVIATICLPAWYQYTRLGYSQASDTITILKLRRLEALHELPQIRRIQQGGDDYPSLSNNTMTDNHGAIISNRITSTYVRDRFNQISL
jgi:hypothetical protein